MKFFSVSIFVLCLASMASAGTPSDKLMRAELRKESTSSQCPGGGDDNATGDKYDKEGNLKDPSEWSYGCYQIHFLCMQDYNKRHGTHYAPEDCLGNRELSEKVFRDYMEHYATKKRLGHEPTDEDMARIWNGGPNGWRLPSTLAYWNGTSHSTGVKQYLED
jgi:hypothetical protein